MDVGICHWKFFSPSYLIGSVVGRRWTLDAGCWILRAVACFLDVGGCHLTALLDVECCLVLLDVGCCWMLSAVECC